MLPADKPLAALAPLTMELTSAVLMNKLSTGDVLKLKVRSAPPALVCAALTMGQQRGTVADAVKLHTKMEDPPPLQDDEKEEASGASCCTQSRNARSRDVVINMSCSLAKARGCGNGLAALRGAKA